LENIDFLFEEIFEAVFEDIFVEILLFLLSILKSSFVYSYMKILMFIAYISIISVCASKGKRMLKYV